MTDDSDGIFIEMNTENAPDFIAAKSPNWHIDIRNSTQQSAEEANVVELVSALLMGALALLQDTMDNTEDPMATFFDLANSIAIDMKPLHTAEELMHPPPPEDDPKDE